MAFYVDYMKDLLVINTSFVENAADYKIAGAIYVMVLRTLYQHILFLNCEFIRNSGAVETGTLHLVLLTSPQARVTIQNTKFIKKQSQFSKFSHPKRHFGTVSRVLKDRCLYHST